MSQKVGTYSVPETQRAMLARTPILCPIEFWAVIHYPRGVNPVVVSLVNSRLGAERVCACLRVAGYRTAEVIRWGPKRWTEAGVKIERVAV